MDPPGSVPPGSLPPPSPGGNRFSGRPRAEQGTTLHRAESPLGVPVTVEDGEMKPRQVAMPSAGPPRSVGRPTSASSHFFVNQIVMQELCLDEKGRVRGQFKYMTLRDLYAYIDGQSGKDELFREIVQESSDSLSPAGTEGEGRPSPGAIGASPASVKRSSFAMGAVPVRRPMKRRTSGEQMRAPSSLAWLHPRDLRKLDSSYSASNEPSIIVRRNVILLNFDPLRAIVLHDRLLLLVPDGADSVLLEIEHRLEEFCKAGSESMPSALDHDEKTPFELNAIESILSTLAALLDGEYAKLEPMVTETLQAMHDNHLRHAQDRLKFVKNNVDAELTRLDNTKKAIVETLDDDADMAMMQLTKVRSNPLRFTFPLSPEAYEDHDDVEILLEAYLQTFSTIGTKLLLLDKQITNTEEDVMLKLDLARNRLLTVDTVVAVLSCGVGLGSMIAGIFGMNVRNGYENDGTDAFYGIIWVTTVVIAFSVGAIVMYLYKAGVLNV